MRSGIVNRKKVDFIRTKNKKRQAKKASNNSKSRQKEALFFDASGGSTGVRRPTISKKKARKDNKRMKSVRCVDASCAGRI